MKLTTFLGIAIALCITIPNTTEAAPGRQLYRLTANGLVPIRTLTMRPQRISFTQRIRTERAVRADFERLLRVNRPLYTFYKKTLRRQGLFALLSVSAKKKARISTLIEAWRQQKYLTKNLKNEINRHYDKHGSPFIDKRTPFN